MSTNTDNKKEGNIYKDILEMIAYFVFVIVAAYLIVTFVGQRTIVNGSSMESTLSNGDNLIVDKISYRFNDPKRFDIIVFPYAGDEDTYFIKRIIGLPGETVQIEDGKIYIDGEVLEEDYGLETIENEGRAEEEITLADDEYFVMGDNRNNSMDSREEDVGNIKRKSIVGRAFLRVYPFNKMGKLKHQ